VVADYGRAVANYGQANISYVLFNYADTAIGGGNWQDTSLNVTDSEFHNAHIAISQIAQNVTLERNTFDVSPSPTDAAVQLSSVTDISTIMLSGANENVFVGSGSAKVISFGASTLPVGKSMTVDTGSGATLQMGDRNDVIAGTLTINGGVILLLIQGTSWFQAMDVTGTLNLQAGAIVKTYQNLGIQVETGGTLNANGTSTNPVIFTSYRDDSVGGDTNGDGTNTSPVVADYGRAVASAQDSTVSMSHTDIQYADTAYYLNGQVDMDHILVAHVSLAFNIYDGDANLIGVFIDGAYQGLTVSNASVVFRGTFNDISDKGIQACDWNSTSCSVDASYTDWGSAGPTSSLVCGQVTVAPWKDGSTTVNSGLFASKNCNGSTPTPDEQLATAATNYSDRTAIRGIDCSNGFQDACDAIQTAQQCLGAAVSLAASTSSFPLPNGNAYDQPAQWGSMLADNASTYIQSQEGEIPILSAASFGTQLLGAVQTIMNVANAYNTCAP
jgi:hypothetical protein